MPFPAKPRILLRLRLIKIRFGLITANDRNGTRTRTTTLKGLWLKPVGPCGLKGKDNCQLSHGFLTCSLLIISSSLLNTVLLTIPRWIYSSLQRAAPPIPWESFCGNPAAAAEGTTISIPHQFVLTDSGVPVCPFGSFSSYCHLEDGRMGLSPTFLLESVFT